MNVIEKFYSDAKRAADEGSTKLAACFRAASVRACPDAAVLIDDFAYVIEHGTHTPHDIERAVHFFALVSGQFDDTMDFSDDDWTYVRDAVSACAGDIDFSLVSAMMGVLVRRKKM